MIGHFIFTTVGRCTKYLTRISAEILLFASIGTRVRFSAIMEEMVSLIVMKLIVSSLLYKIFSTSL